MSTVKTNAVQIGQSPTATNNFTFYQPTTPDGSVRIGNGNVGAATDKIIIQSTGDVGVTGGITAGNGITVVDGSGLIQAGSLEVFVGATVAGDVTAGSYNGGQLAGLRNRVINGDMRIDQRQNGGSLTITSAGVYTVDRSFSAATGANLTGNRTTTGTASFGCSRATQFIGAASNTGAQLGQRIEAANLQDFATGTTITISCYIYSSAAFTPTWQWITATTTDATYSTVGASGSFAAVPATTWTRVTATFTAPANTTNGAQVTIQLGATLAGVTKLITGLQVEVGPVATPFEQRPIGMELALCQRYYYEFGTFHVGMYSTTNAQGDQAYPVIMRTTTPAFTFTDSAGTAGQVTIYNGAVVNTTISAGSLTAGANRLIIDANTTTGGATTWLRAYNCKISAEL